MEENNIPEIQSQPEWHRSPPRHEWEEDPPQRDWQQGPSHHGWQEQEDRSRSEWQERGDRSRSEWRQGPSRSDWTDPRERSLNTRASPYYVDSWRSSGERMQQHPLGVHQGTPPLFKLPDEAKYHLDDLDDQGRLKRRNVYQRMPGELSRELKKQTERLRDIRGVSYCGDPTIAPDNPSLNIIHNIGQSMYNNYNEAG